MIGVQVDNTIPELIRRPFSKVFLTNICHHPVQRITLRLVAG